MSLYGFVLFVHVVFAIVLVGGSAYAHVTTALIPRARTVDGIRSHADWLHALVRASGPISAVVLLAGVYLAFDGAWWGRGWPAVSLVLFLLAGVAAFGIIEPKVRALKTQIDETPDGPVTPELGERLVDRTLVLVSWTLAGADLALVFLMTNKPGLLASLLVAVVGLAIGAVLGQREVRAAVRTAQPVPPPGPAAPGAAA